MINYVIYESLWIPDSCKKLDLFLHLWTVIFLTLHHIILIKSNCIKMFEGNNNKKQKWDVIILFWLQKIPYSHLSLFVHTPILKFHNPQPVLNLPFVGVLFCCFSSSISALSRSRLSYYYLLTNYYFCEQFFKRDLGSCKIPEGTRDKNKEHSSDFSYWLSHATKYVLSAVTRGQGACLTAPNTELKIKSSLFLSNCRKQYKNAQVQYLLAI